MKKIWIILIAAFAIIAIIVFVVKSKKDNPEAVTAENVELRNIIEIVTANGKVQPEIEVKISADVSGEIVELLVQEGDKVAKGELLLRINPDIYQSTVARMRAQVNNTKANKANAEARLAQAQAQFVNAKATYERNEKLFAQKALSQSEFDAATSQFEVAKAEVTAATKTIEAATFSINSASAALKEAEDNLLRTSIFSPMEGTVSTLNVELGERVLGTSQMQGTDIMRIANLQNMEVNVEVNEADIIKVHLGDTAYVTVDAYLDRTFKGIVSEVANSAQSTSTLGDQITTFKVKVRILRTSYEDLQKSMAEHLSPFRPGMSATVDIHTKTERDVIAVPISAVAVREDTSSSNKLPKQVVFLLQDETAVMREVKTSIQDSKYIQIVEGVAVGDEIITGPFSIVSKTLEDGTKVKKTDRNELYEKLSKAKK